MNVLERPILRAIICVRIMRDKAGVCGPKRLVHPLEMLEEEGCGIDFVLGEDAAWIVWDGKFVVIDEVLVSCALHHPVREIPVEGAWVDQVMVVLLLRKCRVSRNSEVFAKREHFELRIGIKSTKDRKIRARA